MHLALSRKLFTGKILDFYPVALFDDLRDPLPMTMTVISFKTEDANGPGFLDQCRKFVKLFLCLRRLEMFRVDFVQSIVFAGTRGQAALFGCTKATQMQI